MRLMIFLIGFSVSLQCCNSAISHSVSRIIDGNTIELSNGVIVSLDDVSKHNDNIAILERYLKGKVLLYNKYNEEISIFGSDHISAIVYNSDGDCINSLLVGAERITKVVTPPVSEADPKSDKTTVRMTKDGGVFVIPIEINTIQMYFIFDTGASLISISSAEATKLLNTGKLTDRDILGKSEFSDANGDISEGTIINLSTVKIGNRVLNDVLACVVENQNAPLLLGQSALGKFGKISIDYERSEITFD